MSWTLVYADAHVSNRCISMRILALFTHSYQIAHAAATSRTVWVASAAGINFFRAQETAHPISECTVSSVRFSLTDGCLPLWYLMAGGRHEVSGASSHKDTHPNGSGPHPYDFCNLICLSVSPISKYIHIGGQGCNIEILETWLSQPHILLLLFSHSFTFDYVQLHGLQHARLPCPSSSPGDCSNSCPLCRWCHPTISSSVVTFSSCPKSFPASESCPMNRLFRSGGKNIGASASASVLPMNIQGWFPLGLTGLISLQFKGLSRVFSSTSLKALILWHLAFFMVQISHPYMTTRKTIALTRWTFVGKVMSLLFNTLSKFVTAFLPRSKHLLISQLQSPSHILTDTR